MSGTVETIRPKERVVQDSAPIVLIYRNMGTNAAERTVSLALGDLSAAMAAASDLVRQRELADVPRRLSRLRRMGENLGMVSLAEVAEHAANCLRRGDATAFAAVWARLLRVAEISLATDKGLADRVR